MSHGLRRSCERPSCRSYKRVVWAEQRETQLGEAFEEAGIALRSVSAYSPDVGHGSLSDRESNAAYIRYDRPCHGDALELTKQNLVVL